MRGYPKHLNTKADMDYVLKHYPDKAKKDIQRMLDSRHVWETTGGAVGDGVTRADQRVIEEIGEDKSVVKLQQRKVADPNCQLFRLGISVAEAQKVVATVEKV